MSRWFNICARGCFANYLDQDCGHYLLYKSFIIIASQQGLTDIYQTNVNLQEPILTLLMGQVSQFIPSESRDFSMASFPVQSLLSTRQGHTTPCGVGLMYHCVSWGGYQGGAPGRWGLLGRTCDLNACGLQDHLLQSIQSCVAYSLHQSSPEDESKYTPWDVCVITEHSSVRLCSTCQTSSWWPVGQDGQVWSGWLWNCKWIVTPCAYYTLRASCVMWCHQNMLIWSDCWWMIAKFCLNRKIIKHTNLSCVINFWNKIWHYDSLGSACLERCTSKLLCLTLWVD